LLGAIGVSGVLGGERDEVCALKGIEAIQERLDFAMYLVLCGPVPADPFPGRGGGV